MDIGTFPQFLVALLLGGLAVLIVAGILPGFRLKGGFGSAVLVALVYGLLKALLQTVLIVVTFPAVILTLGLFILVINAFLLWLTDKILGRLEVKSFFVLMIAAFLLSILDLVFHLVVKNGAIF